VCCIFFPFLPECLPSIQEQYLNAEKKYLVDAEDEEAAGRGDNY
jgi:hypothetical protein